MKLILRLLITTIIVLLLSYFMRPRVQIDDVFTAVTVAIVLALLNTFLKPILVFFTFPITIFTLGLFLLIINAGMVYLCGYLVDGFKVTSFGSALLFSILLSISQSVLYQLIKD